jgi:hypothetical protein
MVPPGHIHITGAPPWAPSQGQGNRGPRCVIQHMKRDDVIAYYRQIRKPVGHANTGVRFVWAVNPREAMAVLDEWQSGDYSIHPGRVRLFREQ